MRYKLPRIGGDSIPPILKVRFPSYSVVLLRQNDGYCGVPYTNHGRVPLSEACHINLTKERLGEVTPAGVIRTLARRVHEQPNAVSDERYKQVINDLLAAVYNSARHWDRTIPANLEEVAELPPYLRLATGPPSPEESLKCALAGVPEYVVNWAATLTLHIVVNVRTLVGSLIGSYNFQVAAGAWDAASDKVARTTLLPTGIVVLAKQGNLRLTPVPTASSRRQRQVITR